MTKPNFVYQIFLNYAKEPNKYCLWQNCTTCGCYRIRDEIFYSLIDSIDLKFEDTGMEKGFLLISKVKSPLYEKLRAVLVRELNALSDDQIIRMLGPSPFIFSTYHRSDNVLKFIIMEIYNSMMWRTQNRSKTLNYFKLNITNRMILFVIQEMNRGYEELLTKRSEPFVHKDFRLVIFIRTLGSWLKGTTKFVFPIKTLKQGSKKLREEMERTESLRSRLRRRPPI